MKESERAPRPPFMDWLDHLVNGDPEARAAADAETRALAAGHPAPARCRIGWHRWSAWRTEDVEVEHFFFGRSQGVGVETQQSRECLLCGRLQREARRARRV